MSLQSDLTIRLEKLRSSAVSPRTATFNERLQNVMAKAPKWYKVGAARYRVMRENGDTPFPASILLPNAKTYRVPSRETHRKIPCRIIVPRSSAPRGVLMHIHGGGWVLNDEKSSDTYLQAIADLCGLTCVSVGYRLAPENPFPAAPHDCFDVAEWLIANAEEVFGARLEFVCGESAGGNLACLVVLHLLHSSEPRNSKFRFKGVLSHYGTHSLQWFAGTKNFKKDPPLVLDEDILNHFRAAYVPNFTQDQITSPQVSPIFADLASFELPPALFTCGSEDCLLEDSISMCIRWMIAGSEAILKIYPGSPHGYIVFPIEAHKNVATALGDVKIFVDSQMSQSQQASL